MLKAIKEVELDYQMRKVAERDYREMVERYRTRAMRLMTELEAGDDFRALIEKELAMRLKLEAVNAGGCCRCVSVGTFTPDLCRLHDVNDGDAQFCKKCGQTIVVPRWIPSGRARRASTRSLTQLIALAAVAVGASPARAQPMMGGGGGMPNLREVVGRPLPDSGMPTGTVSVRVARRMPANGVAGAEVSAVIKNAGRRPSQADGEDRRRRARGVRGDDARRRVPRRGDRRRRAPRDADLHLAPVGGLRTMLIAALGTAGAPPAGDEAAPAAGGGEGFSLGATAGVAVSDSSLPAGRLDVRLYDENGAPIPNHPLLLGMVDKANKIDVRHGKSDATGVAHFADLPRGDGTGYAAVLEWHGMRLGTAPFPMPESAGARAEIRALGRTADPAVMTIGAGGRVIIQMHEDNLQFLEMFPLENSSDKMFDPGPGALELPLPQGFVGAEAQESDRKIDVRQNHGMAVHGVFAPKRSTVGTSAKNAGNEVVFGFVLPYHGDTRAFAQPMPNGIGSFTLITEQIPGLTVTGPGIGERQERELGGRKYWVMPVRGDRAGRRPGVHAQRACRRPIRLGATWPGC